MIVVVLVATAGYFMFFFPRVAQVNPGQDVLADSTGSPQASPSQATSSLDVLLEEPVATATPPVDATTAKANADIERQPQLTNPPTEVRGLYMTGWIGGIPRRVNGLLDLAVNSNMNAFVVDVKDYSGYVSYVTGIPEVKSTGAEKQIRIARPNALIKQLHDRGMYAIARIAVFEDTILATAHPEWALKRAADGKLWRDGKGLAWMDAASENVWAYNVAIAKDALARGFDEVNFDYIRFPSDGSLKQISYPVWDEKTARHKIIANFFKYLDKSLPDARTSVDLFGLVTVDKTDLGIGQVMADAFGHVDAIAPMVYPSHFANGFQGYKNPATHPYEVVNYSMTKALQQLNDWQDNSTSPKSASSTTGQATSDGTRQTRLRPWLQVFDLGAVYDRNMVQKQVDATKDVLDTATSSAMYGGYLLWDPKNTYEPLK